MVLAYGCSKMMWIPANPLAPLSLLRRDLLREPAQHERGGE